MKLMIIDDRECVQEQDVRSADVLRGTYSSEHYTFCFRPGSFAEKHIEEIAAEQESCFRRIESMLEIPFPMKIRYFLTETPEENGRIMEELFGEYEPGYGFAVGPNNVFAVYSEEIRCIGAHEDTHLVSYAFCAPPSAFFCEGLAMYTDGAWWGEPNTVWVGRFLKNGGYRSVQALSDDETFWNTPCEISYPIAGAFIAFLVDRVGIKTFLEQLYKPQCAFEEKIERVFKTSPEEVEKSFLHWVETKSNADD